MYLKEKDTKKHGESEYRYVERASLGSTRQFVLKTLGLHFHLVLAGDQPCFWTKYAQDQLWFRINCDSDFGPTEFKYQVRNFQKFRVSKFSSIAFTY